MILPSQGSTPLIIYAYTRRRYVEGYPANEGVSSVGQTALSALCAPPRVSRHAQGVPPSSPFTCSEVVNTRQCQEVKQRDKTRREEKDSNLLSVHSR